MKKRTHFARECKMLFFSYVHVPIGITRKYCLAEMRGFFVSSKCMFLGAFITDHTQLILTMKIMITSF